MLNMPLGIRSGESSPVSLRVLDGSAPSPSSPFPALSRDASSLAPSGLEPDPTASGQWGLRVACPLITTNPWIDSPISVPPNLRTMGRRRHRHLQCFPQDAMSAGMHERLWALFSAKLNSGACLACAKNTSGAPPIRQPDASSWPVSTNVTIQPIRFGKSVSRYRRVSAVSATSGVHIILPFIGAFRQKEGTHP